MVPEDLARQSLSADAAFCLAVGAGATAICGRIGRRLDLPPALVAGAGGASIAWGSWAALSAGATDWRRPTGLAAAGNGAGAVGLAVLALTRSQSRARIGPAILAAQVGGLAAVLVGALVWDRRAHIGTGFADGRGGDDVDRTDAGQERGGSAATAGATG